MSEWYRTTLGSFSKSGQAQIKTGPFGSQLHQSDYVLNGIPVVMPKDIIDWEISQNSIACVNSDMAKKLTVHQLIAGDIVYGRRGDIGRHALITKREEGWLCGTGCIRIRLNDAPVLPEFLSLYLRLPSTIEGIYNQAIGSTMPNLNTSIIENVEVYYPDLSEQKRIIEVLFSYDKLIENNNRRIAILEEMAQRLYREWFVNFRFTGHENVNMKVSEMGKIPEEWSYKTPKELADYYIGGGWGKETREDKLQPAYVIRGTDIPSVRKGIYDNCPLRYHKESNLKKRILNDGDVIIEVSGGSKGQPVGRACLITNEMLDNFSVPAICASFCKLYRCDKKIISPFYFFLWLQELYTCGEIEKYQSQSTGIINFQFEYFADHSCVLVPIEEVKTSFDILVVPLFQQINKLGRENQNLRKTRDLLLPRLIFGDIDISNITISELEV